MQYLLTEQEYENLAPRKERDKYYVDLIALCRQVSNEKVIEHRHVEPQPHGCIRDADRDHYCTGCPVEKICPYQSKAYGK